MNDNEPKKGAVKKFIIEHKNDLTIGAYALTSALVGGALLYCVGRIDQYNDDRRSFGKQLVRAVKVLDDDTKIAFIDAFDGV